MPGYSQLKKLSETVLKLGNEIKLRAERGEKALPVPIPDTIEDIDDSQDFVLGMPEKPKPPEPEPEEAPAEEAPAAEESASDISVDDLLSGIAAGDGAPDLSAFGDTGADATKSKSKGAKNKKEAVPQKEKEPEPPPKPKGISGSGYSGFGFDDDGNLESGAKEENKPDIAALMGGPGKSAAAAASSGATGIPELDAILNPPKPAPSSGATGIPELDAILNPPKPEPPKAPAAKQEAPAASPEPAEPFEADIPKAPEPESLKAQEVDFGALDDIVIEDYAPPEKDEDASGVDASALFGDDVEDFEMPDTAKAEKPKPVFKPLPVEDDMAILKPDIFTDNPVSKENPPYYASIPYGTMPEQPAAAAKAPEKKAEPAAKPAEKPAAKESAPADDLSFDLDDIPEMEDLGAVEDAAAVDEVPAVEEVPAAEETAADAGDGLGDLGGIDFNMDDLPPLDDLGAVDEAPAVEKAAPAGEAPAADATFSMDDLPALDDLGAVDETPAAEEAAAIDEVPAAEEAPAGAGDSAGGLDDLGAVDFNMDDFGDAKDFDVGAPSIDLNMDLPEEIGEVPPEVSSMPVGGAPAAEEAPAADDAAAFSMDDIPPLDDMPAADEAPAAEETPAAADDADAFSMDDIPSLDDMPAVDEAPAAEETPAADDDADAFSMDDIPSLDDMPAVDETPAAEETPAASADADMFSMDDIPSLDDMSAMDETPADGADIGSEAPAEEAAPDFGGMDLPSDGAEIPADAVEAPKSDEDIFSTDGMDMDSFGMPDSFGDEAGASEDGAIPGESVGEPDEATASALDGFDIQDTDSQLSKAGDDFALEGGGDDFSIPGFSEEGADPYANEGKRGGLDQVDFSGAVVGDGKQRTALTEEEYAKFKKNLRDYPLNVRIAVEDMIAKNEFTDEVVFEVIEKILKKVTARQLAGHLEKMLDISLPVPRDYERRSAEEYEAYKASFAYQLKSRILPAVIIGVFAAMILFCLGYLGHRFIYKPLMAEKIYKEGYVLIQQDEFPLSKDKFDEALKYKSKKKWFFKYAQGYREKKQYDLAELFYRNILKRFNHDKQAGLEYAKMEVEDLANYELAEEILKREVLDNHVNDADGILALGDTYLEWATEKDPAKFEDAYQTYSKLQQLYGGKNPNLYQSRFLRYNIRTDQLRNVLELKEFFFTQGQKALSAADWTELSGYLMDKQSGELPAEQEFLRDKIEDVRDMILFAVKAAPEDPDANYNLSRYLVQVGDHTKAMQSLATTEKLFDKATNLRKRSIYKQLNNYRMLGEEYLYDREYLLARKTFNDGLRLYEAKNRQSNFESDKNVGVMYSDMGNLDYFISGDLEAARLNYQNSIDNKNDTPSIRYRVGYIDYSNENYQSALNNFIKASQQVTDDSHLLLALGNTLSLKDDNYAAQGYYDRLLERLDLVREKYGIVSPQTDERAGDMVETYMKASNNLGVSLFRIARQSGSSSKNAASLVNFQNSIRYYDALTRNQQTMLRLPGSNLAEMNLRYATNPFPKFEPEIYTNIPRVLDGEKGLEQ